MLTDDESGEQREISPMSLDVSGFVPEKSVSGTGETAVLLAELVLSTGETIRSGVAEFVMDEDILIRGKRGRFGRR